MKILCVRGFSARYIIKSNSMSTGNTIAIYWYDGLQWVKLVLYSKLYYYPYTQLLNNPKTYHETGFCGKYIEA